MARSYRNHSNTQPVNIDSIKNTKLEVQSAKHHQEYHLSEKEMPPPPPPPAHLSDIPGFGHESPIRRNTRAFSRSAQEFLNFEPKKWYLRLQQHHCEHYADTTPDDGKNIDLQELPFLLMCTDINFPVKHRDLYLVHPFLMDETYEHVTAAKTLYYSYLSALKAKNLPGEEQYIDCFGGYGNGLMQDGGVHVLKAAMKAWADKNE